MNNKIKKGNYVLILSGKYKNKINKVIKINKKKKKILIKNINFLYKNIKYNYSLIGKKIKKEYFINISKVIKVKLINY
ncbi:MAG: KOW motif-containing protein [Candidatus Shikimatogenerans sp. Tder]|uniref:KOW motif-containing protein n=1 Tax=Candidatus Shikimatogenerans sp. Tder TaxID=3158566 RepID=A0AAU7QRE0_9FLAO